MDNDLMDLNIEWIKTLRKDIPFSIIYNTYQPQKGKAFRLTLNKEAVLTELWDWAKHTSSLSFDNQTKLQIKEYHGKFDSMEKAHDFSNVEES
ncbi:3466_t:CDS:2 [Funneliformis geosporum]|uniref:12365_t:CDS:1 n=1 Tax=Funneliformis geosporum TaxID=1117311 RepID=A0A9W4X1P9_9GLOM|nr:3466_t:CDS:2 [Funneliformis geosporum]CAI2195612.1 12365_t:CDS:2 [Funneliformis geosporum]